jgi:thiol-disulfide isomerase/thioredoxin
MELERIIIVLVLAGVFTLGWFVWQYYKARVTESIQAEDVTVGKPNLLYFTAQYCAACKFQQAPIIEAIASKFGDSIAVSKVDVTDQPQLASRYKVLTLPTTVVVSGQGKVTHINRGVVALEQLETQLQAQ